MCMNRDHVASGHCVLGRDVLYEFDYWPLPGIGSKYVSNKGMPAVSMSPTKVCPHAV